MKITLGRRKQEDNKSFRFYNFKYMNTDNKIVKIGVYFENKKGAIEFVKNIIGFKHFVKKGE